jgi:hypothetical protein
VCLTRQAAQVSGYNDALFPHVLPIVEDAKSEPVLVRAALRCFPKIQPASAARVQQVPRPHLCESSLSVSDAGWVQTVQRIGALTLSPDREIANAAIMSLLEYMLENPAANLIPIATIMVRVLSKIDIRPDDVLKTFTNAHLMLSAFANAASSIDVSVVGPCLAASSLAAAPP